MKSEITSFPLGTKQKQKYYPSGGAKERTMRYFHQGKPDGTSSVHTAVLLAFPKFYIL